MEQKCDVPTGIHYASRVLQVVALWYKQQIQYFEWLAILILAPQIIKFINVHQISTIAMHALAICMSHMEGHGHN